MNKFLLCYLSLTWLSFIQSDDIIINIYEGCTSNSKDPIIHRYSINQEKYPKNCLEIRQSGDLKSGVRNIYPFKKDPMKEVSVYSDQTTEGGGWTVILNREPSEHREDFERGWTDYESGFGTTCSEHWIGLLVMHELTNSSACTEMLMEMEDFDSNKFQARYSTFKVGSQDESYVLTLGGFGPADFKDSFASNNGMKFTTKDRDNDTWRKNCAITFRGGWWYADCHGTKLTGFPYEGAHSSYSDGIHFHSISTHHKSFKKASMKVRPDPNCLHG